MGKTNAGRFFEDYRIGQVVMPEGPFDLQKFMAAFNNIVEFAEVGEGSLSLAVVLMLFLGWQLVWEEHAAASEQAAGVATLELQ